MRAKNSKFKIIKNISTKNRRRKNKILSTKDLDFKYKGRSNKWIIIQLAEDCDLLEKYDAIESDLKKIFGDTADYFIPVYREKVNEKPVSLLLFEGYVFVKCTDTVKEWLFKERTENLLGPLYENGKCKYINNKDINKFKDDIQKMIRNKIPEKGQTVIPKEGDYKNLEGRVVSVNKNKMIATVVFEKRSRVVEAPINVINLDIV